VDGNGGQEGGVAEDVILLLVSTLFIQFFQALLNKHFRDISQSVRRNFAAAAAARAANWESANIFANKTFARS